VEQFFGQAYLQLLQSRHVNFHGSLDRALCVTPQFMYMNTFLSPQPAVSSSSQLNGDKSAIIGGIFKRPAKNQNPRRSQRFE
jgi:hypothetical protein